MKPANPQLGLVLTSGGAKGACQVGAIQYIAELGLEPQIIAGTSIGALNGAVLSNDRPYYFIIKHPPTIVRQFHSLKFPKFY